MQSDFFDMLNKWLNDCQQVINNIFAKRFPNLQPNKLIVHQGRKFIKVISTSQPGGKSRSSWAFVAMEDGETKNLGPYKKGDIFKSASWSTPARHARGNIYDNHKGMKNITWTGPVCFR